MSGPAITYTPRPDATSEAELSALAAVYKFVLAKKNAAGVTSTNGDDTKEGLNGSCRNTIIPERP